MIRPGRFALSLLALAGCASIVGIEDHVYESEVSAQCQEYCTTVQRVCTGTNQVYSGLPTCLGVCALLPLGDPLEPVSSNSVVCRSRQASLAESSGEPQVHCPMAGPGGGGECGTNCEAYCDLIKKACPDQAPKVADCPKACAALKDTGAFDVNANHEGDTLQCRLVHVSSATVDPATHCTHAQLPPTPPWCLENQTAAPNCEDYCRLNIAACTGDLAVYESKAQCLAVCAALPPGTNGDRSENTVGCRQWHCYNSLLDPPSHCSHTGPGGDGHCGADGTNDAGIETGNCVSYCRLLSKGCATDFQAKYGADDATAQSLCQQECSHQPDAFGAQMNSKYKINPPPSGNTLACRFLHVSRALTDTTTAATECPSAMGNGECM